MPTYGEYDTMYIELNTGRPGMLGKWEVGLIR